MAIKQLTPYLSFGGTSAAAIELYTRALGAEVVSVMRYSDMPSHVGTPKPENVDKIMHAELRVGGVPLMLSDAMGGEEVATTSNVSVTIDFDDHDHMAKTFAALGEAGTVGAPLHDAFWGGKFGIVTDKFGITWLFTSNSVPR